MCVYVWWWLGWVLVLGVGDGVRVWAVGGGWCAVWWWWREKGTPRFVCCTGECGRTVCVVVSRRQSADTLPTGGRSVEVVGFSAQTTQPVCAMLLCAFTVSCVALGWCCAGTPIFLCSRKGNVDARRVVVFRNQSADTLPIPKGRHRAPTPVAVPCQPPSLPIQESFDYVLVSHSPDLFQVGFLSFPSWSTARTAGVLDSCTRI